MSDGLVGVVGKHVVYITLVKDMYDAVEVSDENICMPL